MVVVLLAVAIAALTACGPRPVYDHYEHVQQDGWEKADTLFFDLPVITTTGRYRVDIGLRTVEDYPFTGLNLRVEQRVSRRDTATADTTITIVNSYTLQCRLATAQGRAGGRGISHYQYEFPLTEQTLMQHDSVRFIIRHNMKREMLPGVADIGVKLTRK